MSRERLESRRYSQQFPVTWNSGVEDVEISLGIGFYDDGRPAEVFAIARKSHLDAVLADAAVLISLLLQEGWKPADLARMALREDLSEEAKGKDPEALGKPLSPIGVITGLLAALEELRLGAARKPELILSTANNPMFTTPKLLAALRAAAERAAP